MSAPPVKRDERGRLLAGGANLNPGGRPRGAIEEVRALLSPHAPQLVAQLIELAQSQNEATRLAAIREAFDRLLGKARRGPDNHPSLTSAPSICRRYRPPTGCRRASRSTLPPRRMRRLGRVQQTKRTTLGDGKEQCLHLPPLTTIPLNRAAKSAASPRRLRA
jgi:hypothetical protein